MSAQCLVAFATEVILGLEYGDPSRVPPRRVASYRSVIFTPQEDFELDLSRSQRSMS